MASPQELSAVAAVLQSFGIGRMTAFSGTRWSISGGGTAMTIRASVASALRYQGCGRSAKDVDVQPLRRPIIIRLMTGIFTCMAVVTLSLVGIARARTVPSIQPLQQLLPGGSLPSTANCLPSLFHYVECHVE